MAGMHRDVPNPFITPPPLSNAALAAQYDNNSAARNTRDLAGLRALSSHAFAHVAGHVVHRFSADVDDAVDIFMPAGATRPVPAMVFVHGGRWRLNTSRETAFWAEACVQHGMAWVGINFPALGNASLRQIEARVASAIGAVVAQAGTLGIEADALVLAGHSSGAHLALSAAMTPAPWVARLRAMLLLGGMYDLRPLARCTPAETLGFCADEAQAASPLLALESLATTASPEGPRRVPVLPPTLVAVGAEESPEFVRQAQALHWRLQQLGLDAHYLAIAGRAHFDAALEFNAPASALRDFVAARLDATRCTG